MGCNSWKYYNHAAIPQCAPNEKPDLEPIENGTIWKGLGGGKPLLARWTTEWDCGYETFFWYVIKDSPFDVATLNSKNRYKITKGCKNFEVKVINPREYREQLYNVQVAAFSAYPKKYRPTVDKKSFMNSIDSWDENVFGAFYRDNNELVGYVLIKKQAPKFLSLSVQKTKPKYEKLQVNAALVKGLMDYYEGFLSNGGIICDGARNVAHETHFQDYLEKYFGFRKAYCNLHIEYNPKNKWVIKMLFPFRKLLGFFDEIGLVHQINSVMKMEEICRLQDKL